MCDVPLKCPNLCQLSRCLQTFLKDSLSPHNSHTPTIINSHLQNLNCVSQVSHPVAMTTSSVGCCGTRGCETLYFKLIWGWQANNEAENWGPITSHHRCVSMRTSHSGPRHHSTPAKTTSSPVKSGLWTGPDWSGVGLCSESLNQSGYGLIDSHVFHFWSSILPIFFLYHRYEILTCTHKLSF